jgi:3-oxoacyl-[acyl-carrier protein] reductase
MVAPGRRYYVFSQHLINREATSNQSPGVVSSDAAHKDKHLMDLQLQNKRAIITGGSRGIGLSIAKTLAQEGCSIGLMARGEADLLQAEKALREMNVTVFSAVADVTQNETFNAALSSLIEKLGGVEIAVANAGASAQGPALSAPDETWRAQWELNFMSAVRLLRGCAPSMEKAGYGAFTIISSISGLEAFGYPAYIAAKAPLQALAKVASKEGAAKNIRVNCVAPGSIMFPGSSWDKRLKTDPARVEQVAKSIPFGRLGTPEEIANVVAFLSSPKSSWVTGTTVVVDGGQINRI